MASPNGQHPPVPGHDSIEFTETPSQLRLEKQSSSSSSGPGARTDEKNAALPVEQYAVDSEKQSERVGSLQARSDPERGPLRTLWHRHWKKVAQLVTFMVFTASVIPLPGARSVPRACGKPS